ncbi:ABC-2 type transport system permease protein [Atopostipes suicloacalis DSM 15692]|uniref:ABC-2 type transport system permease protein n=1 Tax=Atopostipes suicloacalis DSM 15692 TaxID=1121025 RepID=A0A1M4Y6T8_9LACT|nr:hypothetical protein [Atopostipes suicloacalis]SHF01425.1 ABC-2 type transport system permease protein [Atopostipes suicloacalis DSM 15692]
MCFDHIKALVEVDLLQSNRQMSNSNQANKLKKKNIYWRTFLQNVVILFVFVILYGSMIFNIPLANFPGVFTQAISFMVTFSILQLFQLIFTLFYDDTDLSTYLAMPFSIGELFTSKIATVIITSFAYFVSPFIFIVVLGQQTDTSLWFFIPIGLLSTVLIMVATVLGVFILLDLLNQWAFFRKHKKIFTILLYILLFGFVFYNVYGGSMDNTESGLNIVDEKINPLFVGFHQIFISGEKLNGWLKIGLWIFVSGLFLLTMLKWVIPHLYSENEEAPQKRKKKKEKAISTHLATSKWKVFLKYQFRQLQDTTLILQILFSKFYFPVIMMGPIFFGDLPIDLTILKQISYLWGAYLLIGISLAFVMISETSISGVIISFDKENYYYIQSLPISFRGYLKFKFYFAFILEWGISVLALLGVALYLKAPFIPTFLVLIGFTVMTYLLSLYYYMRDYKLLNLSWNNFNELMRRGVSQVVRILIQLVTVVVGILAIFGFIFWFVFVLEDTTRLLISVGITIGLIALAIGFYKYADIKFWSKFNE